MLKEECGIFGVFNAKNAVELTFLGLYSLQHRGQESVGVVYHNNGKFYQLKNMGLVNEFVKKINFNEHKGDYAIGHVRYSTTGSSEPVNIQPIFINSAKGKIGVAHNGNLINAKELKEVLHKKGAIFQTSTDSEIILHLISHSKSFNLEKAIKDSVAKIKGGFALIFITDGALYAVRDRMGNRPLCIGRKNETFFISSEDSALNIIGAEFLREIMPGEILKISKNGITSDYFTKNIKKAQCVFELIYFARPDSKIFGINVHQFREECGRKLAQESFVDADVVISVPDSGNYAALGYSKESKIPFEIGLVRNHYIGRTFIQAAQEIRENDVKLKLMPIPSLLNNKRVVVVDDSIVRGTTSKKIMEIIRAVNVKELHLRIASPPYKYPCFYGIDTPEQKEFIAHRMSIEKMCKYLNVDSIAYLSLEGLKSVLGNLKEEFCYACFNGKYPQKINTKLSKKILEE